MVESSTFPESPCCSGLCSINLTDLLGKFMKFLWKGQGDLRRVVRCVFYLTRNCGKWGGLFRCRALLGGCSPDLPHFLSRLHSHMGLLLQAPELDTLTNSTLWGSGSSFALRGFPAIATMTNASGFTKVSWEAVGAGPGSVHEGQCRCFECSSVSLPRSFCG